jgi:hypothetical protein
MVGILKDRIKNMKNLVAMASEIYLLTQSKKSK